MEYIELVLLIITYSALILTLFISIICYLRNLEKWETIAFIFSLLFLVISMTIPITQNTEQIETPHVLILLSMSVVGIMTPLSVMSERQHKIPNQYKKLLYSIGILIFVGICIAYVMNKPSYMEYVVNIFLGLSVVGSMLLIRYTKPQKNVAHLEKTNRIFALAFLVFVPISLIANFTLSNMGYKLTIGLTIPLIFILLAINKLFDDLKRLSLVRTNVLPNTQHFKNYSISKREQEIAVLIIEGKTYKDISEELFISISTVKTHTSRIYKKCGVKNRNELSRLLSN